MSTVVCVDRSSSSIFLANRNGMVPDASIVDLSLGIVEVLLGSYDEAGGKQDC